MIENNNERQRFRAYQYLLCVMVEGGHRVIYSPDFDFRFAVPVNHDPHRYDAAALRIVEEKIDSKLRELDQQGLPHPVPKKWKDNQVLSVKEAAEYLGVSPSTLRRMNVPFQETPGGHRRYLERDLENWKR